MRLTGLILFFCSLFPSVVLARPWTPGDPCPIEIKTAVIPDPCLVGECSDIPRFTTMDSVHAALTSCPKITLLDLRVSSPDCTGGPSRRNFPFDPNGGETYRPLKTLRLEGYDFDSEEERRENGNLELWLDAMDWSSIEDFTIKSWSGVPDILKKVLGQSPSLRKVESTDLVFIRMLQNDTLTHVTWIGESNYMYLPTILDHQGESLQSLEFRCPEIQCPSFQADFDLGILPNRTRNLAHVSVNIPRNGTWPLETLEKVAAIPTLRSADLWMNIQAPCLQQHQFLSEMIMASWFGRDYCKDEDQYQRPFLDATSALTLFEYMRDKKDGAELKEVTFWVGDWTRPWDGPLYIPAWVEHRGAKVVCKADVDVEMEDWCIVETGKEYWKMRTPWRYEEDFDDELWDEDLE